MSQLSSVLAIHIWASEPSGNSRRRSVPANRLHQLPKDRGCRNSGCWPQRAEMHMKAKISVSSDACIFLDAEECKFLSLRYLVSLIDNNLWCSDSLPPLLQTFTEPDSFPSSFLPLSSFSGVVEMLPPGLEVLKVSHGIKHSLLFGCEFLFFFLSQHRVLSFFCSNLFHS